MARNGAVEGVGARLQFGGLRFFAFGDRLEAGQFLAALFDHHVVRDRRGVFEVDRDIAGFRTQFGGVEGESGFACFDVQGSAGAAPRSFLLAALAALRAAGLGRLHALSFLRAFSRADWFFFLDRAFGFFFGLFFLLLRFAAEGAAFVFVGARGLAFFDLFAGLLELGGLGALLILRVQDGEGGGADDEDREPEEDQRQGPARKVLQFEADDADRDRRKGEDDPAEIEESFVAHLAAGTLSSTDLEPAADRCSRRLEPREPPAQPR